MIPDEAVEAAAKAVQEVCETYDPGGWTEEANWAIWARWILEAAAPHLMAAAWDEGYLACVDDIFRDQELGKTGQRLEDGQQNPYRKPTDA